LTASDALPHHRQHATPATSSTSISSCRPISTTPVTTSPSIPTRRLTSSCIRCSSCSESSTTRSLGRAADAFAIPASTPPLQQDPNTHPLLPVEGALPDASSSGSVGPWLGRRRSRAGGRPAADPDEAGLRPLVGQPPRPTGAGHRDELLDLYRTLGGLIRGLCGAPAARTFCSTIARRRTRRAVALRPLPGGDAEHELVGGPAVDRRLPCVLPRARSPLPARRL
jgi:hypothetical protein